MIDRVDDIVGLALQQSWQVAVVTIVVAILTWLFGRRRAHLAYLLWLLVLIKCLTPPLWSSPVGVFSWVGVRWVVADSSSEEAGPESVWEEAEHVPAASIAAEAIPAAMANASGEPPRLPPVDLSNRGQRQRFQPIDWPKCLAALWFAGAAFTLLVVAARRLACGWLIRRSSRSADPGMQAMMERVAERLGVRRRVRLLITRRSLGPAVIGWLRPAVLLPESLLRERRSCVESILAHELIHLRRGDTLVALWQLAVQVVWWFHPLVWWANRRMTRERERCCDEEVLAALGCDPAEYAQSLIDVLKMKRRLQPLFALPGVRRIDITAARLHDIMRQDRRFRNKTPWWCWPVLLTAAALLLPGSTLVFDMGEAIVVAADGKKAPADAAHDVPQSHRNNTSNARDLPTKWDAAKKQNVRWSARLGSQTYGTPVVSQGKVIVGTNNASGRVKRFPSDVDLGCLQCFDAESGRFLWQHANAKLASGRAHDWPMIGVTSTPLIEGERVWYVNNRNEIVCLDLQGFRDGENDGPFQEEASTSLDEADVIWRYDLMKELKVRQHNAASCSVTVLGDMLFVNTSHGVDHSHVMEAAAPCFLAMDKSTGKVHWTDQSPGMNILHGQWSSPAVGVLAGQPQVIFAGGDGWVYSFRADKGRGGRPERLWEFDANPKDAVWKLGWKGTRNNILAAPVIHDGSVYIVVGQDPEHGEGPGGLYCIDPSRRGDISTHLVLNKGRLAPRRRRRAADETLGDKIVKNPNSGLIWSYRSEDRNADGKLDFEEVMHRGIGSPVIKNNLLFVADYSGCLHCLDAKTGRVNWTHDLLAACWSTPLIADGKVHISDEDGDVAIFALSRNKKLLGEANTGIAIYSTPVAVGDTLYLAAKDRLLAVSKRIQADTSKSKRRRRDTDGRGAGWPSPRGDVHNSGVAGGPLPADLNLHWQARHRGHSFESTPVIASRQVFVCDTDGRVTARRLEDGKRLWLHELDSPSSASPAIIGGGLYIGDSTGRVYCLDAKTGARRWATRTGGEIHGAAQQIQGRIVIASQDGTVYALKPETGQVIWRYATEEQLRTTPAAFGGLVVIAGCGGKLHIIDAADGKQQAELDIGGPTGATAAVSGSSCTVGNEQGELYRYDLEKGKLIWRATEAFRGTPLRSSAAVDGELAIVGSKTRGIVAVDVATGALVWRTVVRGPVVASPVIAGDLVYCASNDGRLYALERRTGRVAWKYEAGGEFHGSAAVGAGVLLIASSDGVLYCFGE